MIKKAYQLLKETFLAWHRDNIIQLAGALSFFTVISIIPVLILTVALGGYVLGEQKAHEELIKQATLLFSPQIGSVLNGFILSSRSAGAGTASIISVIILYVISSRIFLQLQDAMNWIWKVKKENQGMIRHVLLSRFFSFLLLIGMGLFLVIFFILNFTLHYINTTIHQYFHHIRFSPPSMTVPFVILFLLCAIIYRYVPQTKVAWKDIWGGAALTTFLFYIGREILILYFRYGNVMSFYGAAGSVIVLLVWIYFSAQVFLLGAEFTYAYALYCGSRSKTEEAAETPEFG